jgi:hypothetical protein
MKHHAANISIRPDGKAAGLARAEESMQGLLNALTGGGGVGEPEPEPVQHEQIVSRASSGSSGAGVSPLELALPIAAGPALPAPRDDAAGAYTRPLFCSTLAVSDTQQYPTHPEHPLPPPSHGLHNPYALPLSHKKRSI